MQTAWEDFYKSHNYFHLEPHEVLPAFIRLCDERKIRKVLDLGSGPGVDMLYLAEHGFDVTGVDFSPAAVANAEDLLQSKGLGGKVYVDNLFDKVSTFQAGEFPAIIAINSLEYTDMQTFQTTLNGLPRLLSDHGILLLVVSSEASMLPLDVPEQIFFNPEELTTMVRRHFSILDFMIDQKENLVLFLEKLQPNDAHSKNSH